VAVGLQILLVLVADHPKVTVCSFFREFYYGVVGVVVGEEVGVCKVLVGVISFGSNLCYTGPCSSSLALGCTF